MGNLCISSASTCYVQIKLLIKLNILHIILFPLCCWQFITQQLDMFSIFLCLFPSYTRFVFLKEKDVIDKSLGEQQQQKNLPNKQWDF